jgi:serine/threonine protein phosphatase PrpC
MAAAPTPTTPAVYAATDVGLKRERNEDAYLVDSDLRLYVVADGMGGHAGGGTASRLAVSTIQQVLRDVRAEEPSAFAPQRLEASPLAWKLREAVEVACRTIFRTAQADPSLAGMGTTVTALLVHERNVFLAHVGDSRCYLVRDGRIHQVSEDHSLVNEQVKAGAITADEARTSRFRNIITRSVGFEEEVVVDLVALGGRAGDHLLLCCDGLTNLVDDAEILEVVASSPLPDVPYRLIRLANERGGDDNITVVALRLE